MTINETGFFHKSQNLWELTLIVVRYKTAIWS